MAMINKFGSNKATPMWKSCAHVCIFAIILSVIIILVQVAHAHYSYSPQHPEGTAVIGSACSSAGNCSGITNVACTNGLCVCADGYEGSTGRQICFQENDIGSIIGTLIMVFLVLLAVAAAGGLFNFLKDGCCTRLRNTDLCCSSCRGGRNDYQTEPLVPEKVRSRRASQASLQIASALAGRFGSNVSVAMMKTALANSANSNTLIDMYTVEMNQHMSKTSSQDNEASLDVSKELEATIT